ncbi:MAG: TM2 domain-containing protein [Defluviitaleaceae bacterium]|nr:TM2 domain-containing protein [Defluviitaleaceae bacterium]
MQQQHVNTDKTDMWVMAHTSYFKPEHLVYIREALKSVAPERADALLTVNLHNPTTLLLISIFLGEFGVDRFMLGDIGMGVGKLLTFGGCLVWWAIDIFMVGNRAKDKNYEAVLTALGLHTPTV